MKNILISGSTGLVGSRITDLLRLDFNFIPLLATEVDFIDKVKVGQFVKSKDFDIFLHLGAYTNVNGAELEKDLAHNINVNGTRNVFNSVLKKGKKFVYISTDYVFSGVDKEIVYVEDSKPNPKGVYAKTKYEGEKIVNNKGMILRIAYPYRAQFEDKKDFVSSIRLILERGQEINAVTDSFITPTFIDDIAQALKHLLQNYSPEIYHIVGSDSLTPYNASKLIAQKFNLDPDLVKPLSFSSYFKDYATIRPQYSAMKSIKNNFYKMKTFEQGLDEIVKQLV
ncbi:MAG: sugar nucleotide-binding protein [bacterium]